MRVSGEYARIEPGLLFPDERGDETGTGYENRNRGLIKCPYDLQAVKCRNLNPNSSVQAGFFSLKTVQLPVRGMVSGIRKIMAGKPLNWPVGNACFRGNMQGLGPDCHFRRVGELAKTLFPKMCYSELH